MTAGKLFRPKLRGRARVLLTTMLIMSVPLSVSAHDFWIQPNTFNVAPNAPVSLNLQVGHGKDRQKSLMTADRVTRFDSTGQAGHSDLRPNMRLGDANADTVLRFQTNGLRLLAFETNGTYSELPDIRFNDYIKAEGMTPAINYRAKMKTTSQPGREIYSRRAKAMIQVGPYAKTDDAIAQKVLGLSLEIVPEINPYAPAFKGALPVRIYYYGKPLAGATVMLNNLDFDSRPIETMVTDAGGRASFTLPRNGMWQLNVVWTRPITNDPKADFETLFSSLTLGYPPGSH